MNKANYPGLDYSGPGSTANRDAETGIRYGVISQNSIQYDVMSDIWQESRDLSYEQAKESLLSDIMGQIEGGESFEKQQANIAYYISECGVDEETAMDLTIDIQSEEHPSKDVVWGIVGDSFSDRYECDDRRWLWEKDGYELSNCLVSDVFVSKSPYFTYAQFCSPCVPGACNLDNPFEGLAVPSGRHGSFAEDYGAEAQAIGYVKCYCLGHDFFDGEKAPYEVFSVATGKRVLKVEVEQ